MLADQQGQDGRLTLASNPRRALVPSTGDRQSNRQVAIPTVQVLRGEGGLRVVVPKLPSRYLPTTPYLPKQIPSPSQPPRRIILSVNRINESASLQSPSEMGAQQAALESPGGVARRPPLPFRLPPSSYQHPSYASRTLAPCSYAVYSCLLSLLVLRPQ